MLEKEIYKLGEKMNKPQTKKLDRIEKSLIDNIAIIESILEGLKSDFNYIKNMPDCSVEKEKVVNIDFNAKLPSFVEVVRRLENLEQIVSFKTSSIEVLEFRINNINQKLKLIDIKNDLINV